MSLIYERILTIMGLRALHKTTEVQRYCRFRATKSPKNDKEQKEEIPPKFFFFYPPYTILLHLFYLTSDLNFRIGPCPLSTYTSPKTLRKKRRNTAVEGINGDVGY